MSACSIITTSNSIVIANLIIGFLLNHSKDYIIALSVSLLEHLIISYFINKGDILPFSLSKVVIAIGAIMILTGHVFRIGAMFTAGSNFNHRIQIYKEDNHKLVTHGVFA